MEDVRDWFIVTAPFLLLLLARGNDERSAAVGYWQRWEHSVNPPGHLRHGGRLWRARDGVGDRRDNILLIHAHGLASGAPHARKGPVSVPRKVSSQQMTTPS